MKKYTYHYYIEKVDYKDGIHSMDGIIVSDGKIETFNEYVSTRDNILKKSNHEGERWIIKSLSLLN